MSLTRTGDGTTVLHGDVADQSALHGLLRRLHDLGLPLVSITPAAPDQTLTGTDTRTGGARHDHRHPLPPSTPRSNTAVLWGSWLEVITALAGVGTAVALYSVTRRVSRTAAIGFVTSRVVEAGMILVGVLGVLSIVTLQDHSAGATGAQADSLGVVERPWSLCASGRSCSAPASWPASTACSSAP